MKSSVPSWTGMLNKQIQIHIKIKQTLFFRHFSNGLAFPRLSLLTSILVTQGPQRYYAT